MAGGRGLTREVKAQVVRYGYLDDNLKQSIDPASLCQRLLIGRR